MFKSKAFILAVLFTILGLLGLWRSYRYYGQLLHGWDAQFYYAQARSIVFDRDLDISNDMQLLPDKGPFEPDASGYLKGVPRRADGHIINKYPIGLSLVEVPLIGLGYLLRLGWEGVTGSRAAEPPGYGLWEVGTTAVGLLLATVVGLVCLQQLAARHLGDPWATLAVLAAWFGTSLYYYSAIFPFMAHGLAFTLVVIAVSWSMQLVQRSENTLGHFLGLAAVLGCLFLVRFQQILVVFVLAPWILQGLLRFRGRRVLLLLPLFLFGGLCLVQVGCNYAQTGLWVLNSYTVVNGNLFNWTDPELYLVLCSASRGLLWMSPIVVVAVLGCCIGPARRNGLGWVLLVYGIMQVYVIASSNWPTAGDSFGSRYWCECSPLVAVGLTSLAKVFSVRGRALLSGISAAEVGWTMLLMVMYMRGEIVLGMSHAEMLARVRDFLRF